MLKSSDSENVLPTIILIAKHFGMNSGGEAVKAFQFAEYLIASGYRVKVLTHQRAIQYQGGADLDAEFILVSDNNLQRLLWRLTPLRGMLDVYFHLIARLLINSEVEKSDNAILHYIGPVSPIAIRFLPRGHHIVLGPLTGNIFYPPGFRNRATLKSKISELMHSVVQFAIGLLYPEKRRAGVVLVSGYERTRASLRLAGVRELQMVDVVDSGVSTHLSRQSRILHEGKNTRFVCTGRMVDHKAFDLAILAVAQADSSIKLDIIGDGFDRDKLERLVKSLGLQERVTFLGWFKEHDEVLKRFKDYRGYIFPSLAEANGIVMQEAMMVGLPVIASRWGGPGQLATDETAIYVDPLSTDHMVSEIAKAMNRLAVDAGLAERISKGAREIAEERFTWEAVAGSWTAAGYTRASKADEATNQL